MMTLWFAPNTCARVTMTALEEIGSPYETRLIAFMAGEHRGGEYLAVNPSGKVPALETPRGVLVQNAAILTYLAESHPEARLLPQPADPFARARVLSELLRCSSDLHPLVTRFVMSAVISADPQDAPRIRAKAADTLVQQFAPLEARLADGGWYLGEQWSVLDAYLAWIWFRIIGTGFDASPFPALAAHYVQAMDRPSVHAALAREAAAETELDARGLLFRPQFAGGAKA